MSKEKHNEKITIMLLVVMMLVSGNNLFTATKSLRLASDTPATTNQGKLVLAFIETSNVRMIGNGYYGTRQLTLNSPVYTPADLKGKKLRISFKKSS